MRRSAVLGVSFAITVAALVSRSLALPAVAPTGCPCDCNNDGHVTVDEILIMVNVALGNEELSKCTAGDLNGDQMITVDEILTAVETALNGCPVAASPTEAPTDTPTMKSTPALTPSPTPSVVTLNVGSATGLAGQQVSFTVTLNAAGQGVFGTSNVIQFDPTSAIIASDSGGVPLCTSAVSTGFIFVPVFLPIRCTPGSDCNAIGVSLLDPGSQEIPDGSVLYTCTVQILATAIPGSVGALHCPSGSEANAASYADAVPNTFPADCTDGSISVTPALLHNAP